MERVEDLRLGGLKIYRRDDLPGYTTDSVLLADFAKRLKGRRVCDLGTGTGIIPLLLLGRRPELVLTGIEINEELAVLAQKSAALNGLEDRFSVTRGDLREAECLLPGESFDAVICNPPYHPGSQGRPDSHQHSCDEADAARAARWLLKPKGRLYICCPAGRMLVTAGAMSAAGIEPKRIRMASSFAHKAPYLCLMEGTLGAKPGCVFEPQLVLLKAPRRYSGEYKAIYHMEEEDKES